MKSYRSQFTRVNPARAHAMATSKAAKGKPVPCPVLAALEENPRVTVAEIAASRPFLRPHMLSEYCRLNHFPILSK